MARRLHLPEKNTAAVRFEYRRAGHVVNMHGPSSRVHADCTRGFVKINLPAGCIGCDTRTRPLHANVAASGFELCNSRDAPRLNVSAAGAKNAVAANVAGDDVST